MVRGRDLRIWEDPGAQARARPRQGDPSGQAHVRRSWEDPVVQVRGPVVQEPGRPWEVLTAVAPAADMPLFLTRIL